MPITKMIYRALAVTILVLVVGTISYQFLKPAMTMKEASTTTPTADNVTTLMLAGGCFWCVEADLEKLPGVIEVVSGYAGGRTENPTYETYHTGGHREVVEVQYDATQVSFEEILIYALKHMDPTDGAGSFNDRGDYYAPAFYYETETEKTLIEELLAEIEQNGPYDKPLAVKVEPRPRFWPAEAYHQDYYRGVLSGVKYQYYRAGSGRDTFIKEHWGDEIGPHLPWRTNSDSTEPASASVSHWIRYQKPPVPELQSLLSPLAYRVTQAEGTEPPFSSEYDKFWEPGIYVDILSGEPLFSSRDKFDSGTGWPSFVRPITSEAVTEHEDRHLFSVRTEIRSAIADNHLGHVFSDGPAERGGLRYCMNGVALRFVPLSEMESAGYGAFISFVE